ncbi:mRNA surveillance protein pelota [Candidatus Woesearchaeota archaeon]|nr:mRNA surveillance protein pelota [Candidatus Woesearchaeota archaeon]
MKILHMHLKQGEIAVLVDQLDDLWYLHTILEHGDKVKARTLRKISIGGDEHAKVVRKPVMLTLSVENVEFHSHSNMLRILGVIVDGPEDIPRGEHHTIAVEMHTSLEIIKEQWLSFQLQKLQEASHGKKSDTLIVVMDRDEADFALMKASGYEHLSTLKGKVQKKRIEEKGEDFYAMIMEVLATYQQRYGLQHIIIASPAFWKEDLFKEIKDDQLKKIITLANCNATGSNGINEVIKRPEIKAVLQAERSAGEMQIVDQLLQGIAKQGNVAYGVKETIEAMSRGAVSDLLITDTKIKELRMQGNFKEVEGLMKAVEQNRGKVHLISSDHDGGKKLDGLGGMAGLLRYKV